MSEIGFKTKQLAAPKKQIKVSNVMIVRPPKRETIDIQNYINGLRSADRGRRRQLYDVYDNLLADPVIGESIDKRKRHITNGGLRFLDANNEVPPQMAELVESPNFRRMLEEILKTRFYGKTVMELDFTDVFNAITLERRNYDTEKKVILRDVFDTEGFDYTQDDFLLNIGHDKDLGLLMRAAPYGIFKRNGGADYAEFCELWGIPILAGLYDPDDDNARQEMEETMQKRGAGGSIVASKNSEIVSISTDVSGSAHPEFLNWLDTQILIGLIGQTMTSKDGSSLSQSITHADVEDDINEDDQVYVLEVLNHQLLPKLEKRGFPVKGGAFNYPERDNLSLTEKIAIAEKIDDRTEKGVDDDYWYEITGIPKGNKDPNRPRGHGNPFGMSAQHKHIQLSHPGEETITVKDRNLFQRLKDFFGQAPR